MPFFSSLSHSLLLNMSNAFVVNLKDRGSVYDCDLKMWDLKYDFKKIAIKHLAKSQFSL
jgi:hypothetical protein